MLIPIFFLFSRGDSVPCNHRLPHVDDLERVENMLERFLLAGVGLQGEKDFGEGETRGFPTGRVYS